MDISSDYWQHATELLRFYHYFNKEVYTFNSILFREVFPVSDKELVVFDINTGLRPGKELLQELRWENISFENGVAHIEKTKSGEPKTLYLNSVALDILKKRQINVGNGKGAVFGYSYYTVRAAFKRACKRAGIEGVTLHTLRHTFGTRLIEKGADIVTAKDLLHHSSLEMTERYTHPDNKRNRDAVESLVQKGRGAVT